MTHRRLLTNVTDYYDCSVVRLFENFRINMSNHEKKKRLDNKTVHILDLPEQTFREIFLYLDEHAIINLKKICNKVKIYVNNYVEADRRFLVLYNGRDRRLQMENIHMMKCPTRNPRILATMRDSILSLSNPPSIYQKHAFAMNIYQNNVIGLYYAHKNHLWHRLDSTTFHLYSLGSKENKWTRIFPNPPEENIIPENYSISISSQIIFTPITDLDVAVFHINYEPLFNLNTKSFTKSFIQLIRFHVNEDDGKLTYSSSYSLTPEALRSLTGFFLGQKGRGEIILFGGMTRDYSTRNCVWDGTLSVDRTQIIWKETDHVLPNITSPQFMFYFNDNIYILEEKEDWNMGLPVSPSIFTTCHKYSLTDKTCYENVFRLPESWYPFLIRHGNLVSIDKTNKFILIIAINTFYDGAEKDNDDRRSILFFTEKEGFQETRKGSGR